MSKAIKTFLLFLIVAIQLSSSVTVPLDVVGTILPKFIPSAISPYRAFNDLMKQSLPMVPYQLSSWGSIGRCWSCTLNFTNGLPHLYPANLARFVWAVA